jgi:sirohydrochlorin ferrochelatase
MQQISKMMVASSLMLAVLWCTMECRAASPEPTRRVPKVGVLLVNHGSRSAVWREALVSLERSVRPRILDGGRVVQVRTAFMEYNGPSIADQMRAFDEAQCSDVIVVPVFLTVSPHSFDDLPTILGKKEDPASLETLKIEKIERYSPKAQSHITPVPDFARILEDNIWRRARALSRDPRKEGLVLIAYGDETYNSEWRALMDAVGLSVSHRLGMKSHSWGWCGHLVHYDPDSTTAAINRVLESADRAVVVPALIAVDEMFQVRIIGDGINRVRDASTCVAYKPDAILPDDALGEWIVNTVRASLDRLRSRK